MAHVEILTPHVTVTMTKDLEILCLFCEILGRTRMTWYKHFPLKIWLLCTSIINQTSIHCETLIAPHFSQWFLWLGKIEDFLGNHFRSQHAKIFILCSLTFQSLYNVMVVFVSYLYYICMYNVYNYGIYVKCI